MSSSEVLISADGRSPIFADLRRKLKRYGLSGTLSASVQQFAAYPTERVLNNPKQDQYDLLGRLTVSFGSSILGRPLMR